MVPTYGSRWLGTNFHRFGTAYAHPLESLIFDTISSVAAITISGLTVRQVMVFNMLAIWKATSDHCGYVLPWDPFNYLTGNNPSYHDFHHQPYGLKVGGRGRCFRC